MQRYTLFGYPPNILGIIFENLPIVDTNQEKRRFLGIIGHNGHIRRGGEDKINIIDRDRQDRRN